MRELKLETSRRKEFVEITPLLQAALREEGLGEGACLVFVPHTTAGVTINENADPDVLTDLGGILQRLVPPRADYRHREGNSDAHVQASLVGSSVWLIVSGGRPVLGTWQGIYFCEFDGPRSRRVLLQFLRA